MGKFIDLTGKRFGKLVVLRKYDKYKNGQWKWLCKCDCGRQVVVGSCSLRIGETVSCGCHNRESKKRYNEYVIVGNITFVKNRTDGRYFIIDTNSIPIVRDYCWTLSRGGYAITTVNKKCIAMHRLLTNCPDDMQVDHIFQVSNGVCDNRKSNLRVCTKEDNLKNKTIHKNSPLGVTGVSFRDGKYKARISLKGKDICLGTYNTLDEAIKARKDGESLYWGCNNGKQK